jgi:hypothetical protein
MIPFFGISNPEEMRRKRLVGVGSCSFLHLSLDMHGTKSGKMDYNNGSKNHEN